MRCDRISAVIGWRSLRLLRVAVAGCLCVLMGGQPLLAVGWRGKKRVSAVKQIEGDERVLHALNRLTFGPRPSDVAAVRAMGLQRWFEQQLNASRVNDSALEARLAMFPAMKMQQAELMRRYPSPQLLRQIAQTNGPLPSDPVEHAIYANGIAFYEMRKAKLAEGAQTAKNGMLAALPGDGVDPATPAMATHEEQFYSGLEAVKVINLPPDARMQRILSMTPEELISFRRSLSRSELAAAGQGLNPEQREVLAALQGSPRMIGAELLQTRMLRDIYSERQLEAVMTDFWLNHFNVYLKKNQNEPYLLPAFERDVVRPNALGRFEDLLIGTAKSPAMLLYLDNAQSVGPGSVAAMRAARLKEQMPDAKIAKALPQGLNENYARELMELHTLGVNGGYTQADVTQVAKVFTGWTIDRPNQGAEYKFEERRHEPGKKMVLGTTIDEGGESEGLHVLHMLATSPATARFISNKLAVRFVSDTPPAALVDAMTKTFLDSKGDIKAVLRTMFAAPEFWSPEVYRAKVKTPEEFVISAVRASGAEVRDALPLASWLEKLGMPLYGMQTPNGYSWVAEPWVGTGELVGRMNFALALSSNRVPEVRTDWTAILGAQGRPPATAASDGPDAKAQAKERQLEKALLEREVSEKTRATVLQELKDGPMQKQAEKSFSIRPTEPEPMAAVLNVGMPVLPAAVPLDLEAATIAGLLLGSPEFQRR